jgi:hypothetical protein
MEMVLKYAAIFSLKRMLSPARVFGTAVVLALAWGYTAHLDRYITPERGLGYALGIIGGSMMLLLLVYPARKRALWLKWVGGIAGWFQMHMFLGVAGPLLVLFHSNFKLGATNSNVALICMLLVSGSGLVGRYIYGRMFGNYTDRQSSLTDLQKNADSLRRQTSSTAVLPELIGAIEREEQRLYAPAANLLTALLHALTAGVRTALARWRLERLIRRMVIQAARQSPTMASHGPRLAATAYSYAVRRLDANRRLAEHRFYVRMFSLWHVVHVPFFFMLLVAGIVHVISVNVY